VGAGVERLGSGVVGVHGGTHAWVETRVWGLTRVTGETEEDARFTLIRVFLFF